MIQISTRDETYLTLNSVMTLRHSRKRDKIYLKKVCFLRNFLNLLKLYRAFLYWNFRKNSSRAIAVRPAGFQFDTTVELCQNLYLHDIYTEVIFRFYQLTVNSVIRLPHLFSFYIAPIDNVPLLVCSGRVTLRKALMVVCKRDGLDENDLFGCDGVPGISRS